MSTLTVPLYTLPTGDNWLAAARKGDRRALGRLVSENQDAVYRLLYRLCGNRELALDLAQETFVRAFGALERFREGASPTPWLLKIANNLFLDHVRARRPESLDAAVEDGSLPEAGAEDPAIALLGTELDLAAALAQLPVQWRQAVVLRHYEDLPYEAIAEVLGVPVGTVKTWLFRGRDRLRQLLDKGVRS